MSFDAWLKAFHLIGVIFWIGPLLGGWWMLARADKSGDPKTIQWARKAFLPLVHIEHLGLVLWAVFGIWMAVTYRPGSITPLELLRVATSHMGRTFVTVKPLAFFPPPAMMGS